MLSLTRQEYAKRIARPPTAFRFVDVFAGIGGIRMGLEAAGGVCVYTIERDPHAVETYRANFAHDPALRPLDVTGVDSREIPDYDVLAAGFPCQPFSLAGISKKKSLGRAHGFDDVRSGNLFFQIIRLIDNAPRTPAVLFLENVKHLTRHDGGRTFRVISDAIEARGYTFAHAVLDAQPWVPQHRERTFIVALHRDVFGGRTFEFPTGQPARPWPTLGAILDSGLVDARYTLTVNLWDYLQRYAAKHRDAGNGFGYSLADENGVARTLSARYHKDGSEILIDTGGPRPRRLTPRECARLMGYPDSFVIPVSDTQAYRQFGNSVVVPVVEWLSIALARQLSPVLGSGASLAAGST